LTLELVLIAVLLALLALATAFLTIPLTVSLRASVGAGSTRGEVSVRWLGLRLLRRRIGDGGRAGKKERDRTSPKVDALKMIRLARESVPSLTILLRAFRRSVSVRKLSASLNVGLGDPAETATFTGYVWAFTRAANLRPGTSLVVEPDLDRPRLDGSVNAEVGVRLLPLVVGFLRAYSKRPFRSLIREARRAREGGMTAE
jgi:hypothetical protein